NAGNKSLQDYVTSLTPQPTDTQRTQDVILGRLSELTGANTGKTQYQVEQENKYGLPEFQKQLADLNSQIQTGMAEFNKLDADRVQQIAALDNQGFTSSAYFGQQKQIERQSALLKTAKAAELGLLQARSAGINGQIQTAQQLASRAVDLKYSPIED